MAREIQQIMTELETAYAPQRQAVQERMNQLPGFYEAQRGGVETARTNAYQDITRQANARGMVYSGAPIQEQQRYTGERYLPALAQLSGQEGEQRFGLQQALNQLGERQLTYAQQIRTKEQELDEERRRFDLQMQAQREAEVRAARAAASAGAGLRFGNNNKTPNAPAATVRQVYDQSVQQLEGLLKGRNAPSYEQAVDTMVSKFGGQGISAQEIGSYLYNLYSRYFNTSQTKQYFGQGGTQSQRDEIVNNYKQNVAGRR